MSQPPNARDDRLGGEEFILELPKTFDQEGYFWSPNR